MQDKKCIKMTATQFAQWLWGNKSLLTDKKVTFALTAQWDTKGSCNYSSWCSLQELPFLSI